jgi:electron transfer flavoprotein alpha subunit
MQNVLILAELHEGRELKSATLSAITFGLRALEGLGGALDVLVLGSAPESAVEALQAHGARKVIVVTDPSFANYVAENFAPTVAEVGANYGLVAAGASTYGKDLMPRVAARLNAGYAGDCLGVDKTSHGIQYRRPMFAGNAVGTCQITTEVHVATVRQSEAAPHVPIGGSSEVERRAKSAPAGASSRVEFVAFETVKSERPELADAKIIVSGGRALKERFFEVLEPLANAFGAGLGASRAAVDAGYCPGDFQVGQTGKVVAPALYIAVGISGAIQHIAGMKGSKVIVAINKDPDAPIFQVADYGLVADLFQAVPELVRALK